ncbi:hypothetical protein PF010_g23948 [Phytophthora fragariae]|uniref:Uncharacterized protein n=1 Tax=Phytophthora fragariae TaxID=53985 RepID=A0A6G0K4L7_9STRA|nr:hypothetical protein PF010_g23948 [Phytophthora fragariae]
MEGQLEAIEAVSSRRPSNSTSPRTSSWKRLEKNWSQLQVGHHGSYSVERLELLHEYCQATSFRRVLLVCLLTPAPALLVAVVLECLPLRSPSEGWADNWLFWIRVGVMLMFIIPVGAWQLNLFVPDHNISKYQQFNANLLVCVAQLGTFIIAAMIVGFPVPFMWQLGAITIGIYIPVLTRLIYGPALFTKGSILQQHHKKFQDCFAINLTLTGVYPFCRVLYDLLPPVSQGVVVIILPIWKFGAKRFAVRMARQAEDFIPELVAFSVDFFGSLFISFCMTTSGSLYLSALIIRFDCIHSLLKFREIYTSENIILRILQSRRIASSRLNSDSSNQKAESPDLLTVILEVLRDPSRYCVTPLDGVRLWASPPHHISEKLFAHLQKLQASGVFGPSTQSISARKSYSNSSHNHVTLWTLQRTTVVPVRQERQSFRQANQSGHLALHGLQLLFHCEYLVLVEYVECIVPIIFLVYKSVLEQLPNVVYYPGGAGKWGAAAVTNLVVFVVLEIGSLVLLHIFLQQKFAFSPLYQLAFVLETQIHAVQATLFSLTLFVLPYQLAHLGVDFTFHFQWLEE